MSATNLVPNGTRFGNYEVTAFIGEGGMGTVYAAVHLGLGKRVAIKTLRVELAADPDLRARFLREGKAVAAVHHPNVVDVDDVGVQGDTPYLVMELLDGEDLGALVTRSGRLGVQQTVDIVVPVLLAMAAAHQAGVVHRDLKPDNIFLAQGQGGALVPKVLDFGISKLRDKQSMSLTGNNALLGTPYYMSPEQAGSARDVDARSDLYSIGVILYHCVTGRVPFAGESLAQVLGQILHTPPLPLRESIPEVPQNFEQVVLRVMAKDRAQRYQDAHTLAAALLPFASLRIQVTHGHELQSADTLRATESPSIPTVLSQQPAINPQPAAASTLSPHSVVTERTSSGSGWRVSMIVAALVIIALVLYFRKSLGSGDPVQTNVPMTALPPAVAPMAPVAAPPTAAPVAPEVIPHAQASAAPNVASPATSVVPNAVDAKPANGVHRAKPQRVRKPSGASEAAEDVWSDRK